MEVIILKQTNSEQYNEEPVLYCKHCLSLRIMDAGLKDLLYCDLCSSTDIDCINIHKWETLYENRYGFKFLNNNIK